jgi:hypothetical protein
MEQLEQQAETLKTALQQNCGGIAEVWVPVDNALMTFRMSEAQCRGNSCSCLDLLACLQRLMQKAVQHPPQLDTLVDLKVHHCLPAYSSFIPDCPHAAATRLAVAEAYHK